MSICTNISDIKFLKVQSFSTRIEATEVNTMRKPLKAVKHASYTNEGNIKSLKFEDKEII